MCVTVYRDSHTSKDTTDTVTVTRQEVHQIKKKESGPSDEMTRRITQWGLHRAPDTRSKVWNLLRDYMIHTQHILSSRVHTTTQRTDILYSILNITPGVQTLNGVIVTPVKGDRNDCPYNRPSDQQVISPL